MAMDSQGHISWRGNPYLLKNEDTLLMGSTNQGLVVALLPNSAIRRTGCSRENILALNNNHKNEDGNNGIKNNDDEYSDIINMKKVNTTTFHFTKDDDDDSLNNNHGHNDSRGGGGSVDGGKRDDKNQQNETTNYDMISLITETQDFEKEHILHNEETDKIKEEEEDDDDEEDKDINKEEPSSISEHYSSSHQHQHHRRLSFLGYPPSSSDLFVAHCRDHAVVGHAPGTRLSLTQNSSASGKTDGLRQLGLWSLSSDWSLKANQFLRNKLQSGSGSRKVESEATKLAEMISELKPDDEHALAVLHQFILKTNPNQNQNHIQNLNQNIVVNNNPFSKQYGKEILFKDENINTNSHKKIRKGETISVIAGSEVGATSDYRKWDQWVASLISIQSLNQNNNASFLSSSSSLGMNDPILRLPDIIAPVTAARRMKMKHQGIAGGQGGQDVARSDMNTESDVNKRKKIIKLQPNIDIDD
eukprot:CAMPEP_0114343400 /NCGR_PEP_ID=MMETSP0101-20121206/10577_1 /TAXON_ID=38822 ORGANISM="Pteridomonas danica, Strain PT" /NCGR_SAMPLE_ID=MMETSP0101 /ASSEMBLY_ACC=CAM_ASM_000211 /LENGTH=473 /DNA_ID=CAMNT_0001478101 /DNA_START=131 /DNA_END=1552 /DNA_ORIENTATION=+